MPNRLITPLGFVGLFALSLTACATDMPYGPASRDGAKGYLVQQIETNRFRVSYTDADAETARTRALRRAAEVTFEQGADWFQVVNAYDDGDIRSSSRSSVSIGGATGSYGRSSSVGVGLGIGIPLGGSSGKVTHVLEIQTGTGEKPEGVRVYDASQVLTNLTTN